MNKLIILAENGYEDSELIYPYYRLKELQNLEVIVASSESQLISKYGNGSLKPDITIDQIKNLSEEVLGILIPGGLESPKSLRQNSVVLQLLKDFDKDNKLISAICHGVWVLVSAELLTGIEATCYPAIKDDVINAGAKYSDEPVIVDGNIITGRRPRDLSLFMKEVINAIEARLNK